VLTWLAVANVSASFHFVNYNYVHFVFIADQNGLTDAQQLRKDLLVAPVRSLNPVPEDQVLMTVDGKTEPIRSCGIITFLWVLCFSSVDGLIVSADTDTPLDFFLADLYKQLTTVIASKPSDRALVQEGRVVQLTGFAPSI